MEEKTGIVGNISTKYPPWKKFCLEDNDKIWYSTKVDLGFNRGDKISFKYTYQQTEKDDKVYDNYYLSGSATVLTKSTVTHNFNQSKDDFRLNVDAGNAVEKAKDIVVALINAGDKENTDEKMKLLTKVMVDNFVYAKELLEISQKAQQVKTESTDTDSS